jgi:hypothetical protein
MATGIAPAYAADATPLFLNFEAADSLKSVAGGVDGAFEGGSSVVAASTRLTGNSLQFTKAASGKDWAGNNLLLVPSTPYRYTDATKKVITLDYWSNDTVPSPVMLKLQNPGGAQKTLQAQPGFNQLSFDMSTGTGWSASTEYKVMAIFPNFGADDKSYTGVPKIANTGQVYEIDNVSINGGTSADVYSPSGPVTGPTATSTLVTFETGDTLGAKAVGESSAGKLEGSFAGAITSIETPPTGGNGGKALKIVKSVGAENYAGATILNLPSTQRITNGTHKTVTFNYYSPKANSPTRVELAPWPNPVGKTVTVPQGWSRVTVDFTGSPGWSADTNYVSLAIFPDFEQVAGTEAQSYFVDDIAINGATTPALNGPVDPVTPKAATPTVLTFETSDTLGAKVAGDASNAKPEGGFEGASTSIVAAPSGGNGGNALKIVKNVAGKPYAGATLIKFSTATRVTNGTHKTITFNYYSPKANSPTRIELVPHPIALGVTVTAPQGWSTVTIDFSTLNGWSANEEYDSVTFFPDFNQPAGEVAQSYFIDNLAINGAVTPPIPANPVVRNATSTLLTFESTDALGVKVIGESTLQKPEGGFDGAITSIAPAPAGGNGGNALRIVKNVGAEAYAGANLIRFGDDKRVTNGTHKTITFNYFSPKANSPVRIELKAFPDSLGVTLTAPLGWSRLTADFTNAAGWLATEEYVSVAILPDYEQSPGEVALTYFVDNLAFNGAVTPAIPVAKVKPTLRTAASIAGSSFKVGATLTAGKGTWTGTPTITYTYKWFRCTVAATTAGTAAPAASAKCATISGATKSTYKLTKTDIGKFVRVLVTAKNAAGSTLSLSKTTAKKVVK